MVFKKMYKKPAYRKKKFRYNGSKLECQTVECLFKPVNENVVTQQDIKLSDIFPTTYNEFSMWITGVQFSFNHPQPYGSSKFSCGGYMNQDGSLSRNPFCGWTNTRKDKSNRMFFGPNFLWNTSCSIYK